jgi:hypothetical protein
MQIYAATVGFDPYFIPRSKSQLLDKMGWQLNISVIVNTGVVDFCHAGRTPGLD